MTSDIHWTFSPYNSDKYSKSQHRVMFVGAEPNGDKNFKLTDMGQWFREKVEGNGTFYKRTQIMLDSILPHIKSSEERLNHMRFVDLKVVAGDSQADLNEVRSYMKEYNTEVNQFFNSLDYPHYIVFTGGIAHKLWNELRLNEINGIKFNKNSKAVLMPHPKPRSGKNEDLKIACRELNINNTTNKFNPIMFPLWRWSLNGKWIKN